MLPLGFQPSWPDVIASPPKSQAALSKGRMSSLDTASVMTLQLGYRDFSQPPPAPHPTLLSHHHQVSQMQTTSQAENKGLVILEGGKRSCDKLALERQRENEGMRRSGPPDPLDFRVESVQLKCILPQLSSSNATEPPLFPSKLLLPTAQHAATEQAVVMEPECGVRALRQHQKRRSVYPRRPYLKPKQKAPLHPRPFSIQDPGEGQTVVGGHSICRQREACLPEGS